LTVPPLLPLLAESWNHFRKTPAVNGALLWLLIVPSFAGAVAERLAGAAAPYWPGYVAPGWAVWPLLAASLLLNVLIVWGTAAALLAARGKPLTGKTLVRAAVPLIIPLLFTELLRACLTFFWLLLLIVPGILYSLRTSLAQPVVVAEGLAFRPALKRSVALVKGRTAEVAWLLIGGALLLFLPVGFVAGVLQGTVGTVDPRLLAGVDAFQAAAEGIAAVVYVFLLTAVYDHLAHHKAAKK
jgi:hypothetical protein